MKKKRRAKGLPLTVDVELPTKMLKPKNKLENYSFLFHGIKKVGKTTTVLEAERVLFFQHDPPQNAYERFEIYCPDWRTFKTGLRKLEKECKKKKPLYNNVCIDGADRWYSNCMKYVCEKLVIDHPSDEGWGKGWKAVHTEFDDAVNRILSLPLGRWFISHSSWKEQELRDGRTVDRLLPRLTAQAEEILNGAVDAWFAFDIEGSDGKRVLILQGDEVTGAGHRIDTESAPHFRCARTGKPIKKLMLGDSPRSSFDTLMAAFDNEYAVPKKGAKNKKKRKTRDRS